MVCLYFYLFLFYTYACFAWMYIYARSVCLAPEEARRGCQSLLELKLQMVLGAMWVLGTEYGSSGRVASAFKLRLEK